MRGGPLVSALLNAPLIFPGVVVGVALLQFYALVRMNGTFASLALAHMVITLPIVDRALEELEWCLERGARSIGVEVGEIGIFGFFEDEGRVEARAEPLRQRGLTGPVGPE